MMDINAGITRLLDLKDKLFINLNLSLLDRAKLFIKLYIHQGKRATSLK
jgi:hypothetical protein